MEHPPDLSDALLRPYLVLSFHKVICNTSKMRAPNLYNTRYIRRSSVDSPTHINIDRGPVNSLVDISVFLSISLLYLPLVLLISLMLAAHLIWKLLFHYKHACFLYLMSAWVGFLAENTHTHTHTCPTMLTI